MNKDYELKMDGEFHQFEGGAVRYTKTGKGRFDLIPKDVLSSVIDAIPDYVMFDCKDIQNSSKTLKMKCLSRVINDEYEKAILDIVILQYMGNMTNETNITNDAMFTALCRMLRDLAIHYEKGADKYGVDNWKKGIPATSFLDSGMRHLTQYFTGETDEHHSISAIWNLFGLIWTQLNHDNDNLKIS